MRFGLRFDDLLAQMAQEKQAAERAVTRGLRDTAAGLKSDWRGQVVAAGLGQRLSRTIRSRVYPENGASLDAAAITWSRAPKVLDAHDRGALIRSRDGFWLAIPIAEVAKLRGRASPGDKHSRRITPGGWERRTGRRLRFIYRRGKPSLLVDDGTFLDPDRKRKRQRRHWTPIFLLVPQVKLRRKLSLDTATSTRENRLPDLIISHWNKESQE